MSNMTRFQALLMEFGTLDIPLDKVAEKYLGMTLRTANKRAADHQLPFKAYRGYASRKAPRMVSAHDLAAYLDRCEADAEKEHKTLSRAD